jgi:hypothetical protein
MIHEDTRAAHMTIVHYSDCCVSDVQCDVVVCGVAFETDCVVVWRVPVDIAQSMTVIEYKGYRIEVSPVGSEGFDTRDLKEAKALLDALVPEVEKAACEASTDARVVSRLIGSMC